MIADIIAGFLSGVLGAMGFGGGGVLILYLTLIKDVPQITAQGINLIFFIPSAVTALIKHNKNQLIEWKISRKFILWGLLGVTVGYLIIRNVNNEILTNFFAGILIIFGIRGLFTKNKK